VERRKHRLESKRRFVFLLRGLCQIRQEWHWLAAVFSLDRLFGLVKSGAGPPAAPP
jgi:hypothetical protein